MNNLSVKSRVKMQLSRSSNTLRLLQDPRKTTSRNNDFEMILTESLLTYDCHHYK